MDRKGSVLLVVIGIIAVAAIIGAIGYFGWENANQSNHEAASAPSNAGQHFSLIPSTSTARSGDVWLNENANGLVITGKVTGSKPSWPQSSTNAISAFDHVELWLADAQDVSLPPIGWGNQFGESVLSSSKDCYANASTLGNAVQNPDQCAQWFNNQVAFRAQFKKLFVREWQLAPNVAKEVYATAAFNSFPQYIQSHVATLKPNGGAPTMTVSNDAASQYSYDFEVDVPWSALPPMQNLSVQNLKVLVDAVSPGSRNQKGSYASISGQHNDGDLSAFKDFALPQMRDYSITSCHYNLGDNFSASAPLFSDSAASYFMPGSNTTINQTIVLDNTKEGYQYDPDPSGTSPTAYPFYYFEHAVQPGEIICGPRLAYESNGQIVSTDYGITSTTVAVEHISPDEVLVKNGPYVWYSYYGSGQCGACARGTFAVYYLNLKTMTSTRAYSFGATFDANDADFQVSPDWKKITEYDFGPPLGMSESDPKYFDPTYYVWSSTNYCFNATTHVYDACGSNASATPPSPRNFQP
ncbi:MAG TPA: hypothetical protein VMU07_02270 [Candidatus Paceibacterota bacterium]|nr:hypothetical protein [Candidatus Paceibacterota bacterium]